MWMSRTFLVALPLLVLQASSPSYQTEIEQWRREHESNLKADDGWLTVVGLFWLKQGENTVGTDRRSAVVLPQGSAPVRAGFFEFHNGTTSFQPAAGTNWTLNGQPISSRVTLRRLRKIT